MSVATGRYLVTENYKIIIFFRALFGLTVNVVLNLIWIPEYGFMGAAYASLLSYFVPLVLLVFFKQSRPQVKLLVMAFNPRYLIDKLRAK